MNSRVASDVSSDPAGASGGTGSSGRTGADRLVISPRLVLGAILLVAGAVYLLERVGVLGEDFVSSWWPAGMVALGSLQLLAGENRTAKAIGLCLVLLGGTLLVATLSPGTIDTDEVWGYAWPVALLVLGGFLVFRAQRVSRTRADGRLNLLAIWSGQERKFSGTRFTGGEVTAVMGGFELDLRGAELATGEETVLDVTAIMGGCELTVPEDWDVDCQVLPIMGGVSFKAKTMPGSANRLVIRGLALMGGIEVRN